MVIDALLNRYPLPMLLKTMRLTRSSCYYHKAHQHRKDKNRELRGFIRELFAASHGRYGYGVDDKLSFFLFVNNCMCLFACRFCLTRALWGTAWLHFIAVV